MNDYDKIAFELSADEHVKVDLKAIDKLIHSILIKNYADIYVDIYNSKLNLYCDLGSEYLLLYTHISTVENHLCLNIYYAYNQTPSHYYYSKLLPALHSLVECDNLNVYNIDDSFSVQTNFIYMPDGNRYLFCNLFSGEFSTPQ